jgi:hypothetical protein
LAESFSSFTIVRAISLAYYLLRSVFLRLWHYQSSANSIRLAALVEVAFMSAEDGLLVIIMRGGSKAAS